MNSAALPAVIIIGGVAYVLAEQVSTTPPSTGTGGTQTNGSNMASAYDPMGLVGQAPSGEAAKIDALLQMGEKKFAAMADSEKAQAASYLNSTYNIQPPLTGRETWQQTASVVGGAIGGGIAGPLGAIAGAYLGTTLESWLASDLQSIENWINQNLPGAITDIGNDISNWLGF